jgi:beta-lactamase regulating signal transducer with metallopeptidase domain
MNSFADTLLRASWQGGLFIVGMFIFCRLFKGKLSPGTRHGLWWLTCLQLPLRLLFASPVALPLLPSLAAVEPAASVARPNSAITVPSAVFALEHSPTIQIVTPELEQPKRPFPLGMVVVCGWGVGVALVLVLAARRLIRTRHMLRNSRPLSGEALALAAELSRRLGIGLPRIVESAWAPCPLLTGWFKPHIVLPMGFAGSRAAEDLRMAISHEMAHLDRKDLWLAGVPFLTQSLFYFNPIAWLAIRESAAACEEACDVEALRLSGASPSAYARLLLSSAHPNQPVAAMGAAFGFRLLQRRISMLSQSTRNFDMRPRRSLIALVALSLLCAIPWTVTAQAPHKPHKSAKAQPHIKKQSGPQTVRIVVSSPNGDMVNYIRISAQDGKPKVTSVWKKVPNKSVKKQGSPSLGKVTVLPAKAVTPIQVKKQSTVTYQPTYGTSTLKYSVPSHLKYPTHEYNPIAGSNLSYSVETQPQSKVIYKPKTFKLVGPIYSSPVYAPYGVTIYPKRIEKSQRQIEVPKMDSVRLTAAAGKGIPMRVSVSVKGLTGDQSALKAKAIIKPRETVVYMLEDKLGLVLVATPGTNSRGLVNGSFGITSHEAEVSLNVHPVASAKGVVCFGLSADAKILFYMTANGWMSYASGKGVRATAPPIVITVTLNPEK